AAHARSRIGLLREPIDAYGQMCHAARQQALEARITQRKAEIGAQVNIEPAPPRDSAHLVELRMGERIAEVIKGGCTRISRDFFDDSRELRDAHSLIVRKALTLQCGIVARLGVHANRATQIADWGEIHLQNGRELGARLALERIRSSSVPRIANLVG